MKKVLLVTRPIAPPWDEASKNFAYFLSKNVKDVEMHILTKGILPDMPENVHQHPIYTSSEKDFAFSQKLRSLFFQWKNRDVFDAVHYFFTPTKLNSFFLKKFLKSQKTKTIQTVATLREDLYSDEEIGKMMFGNLIITYSDYTKRKLNSLGFENVRKVSPGIDTEKYRKITREKVLKKGGQNISSDDFIINFTGEYTRLGAIDLVVDSFVDIAGKIPRAKLALAVRIKNEKDARKKEEVTKKLKKNDLLDRVMFFDDGTYPMSEVYNLCDISLFPVTNMKGKFDIPLAVVEAMACEKPVIISNLPILSELTNGKNSVIIPSDDRKALSAAILDLFQNPQKRKIIGKEGRHFVKEHFDIQKIAQKYQQIYEKL